jgi:hypothetical protein
MYKLMGGTSMDKIVRLGSSKTHGGRWYSTFARIKITDKAGKGPALSITGVEGPLSSGNALGGCGQIDMHNPGIVRLAPGWDNSTLAKFWDVWHRWHLNDMRSGCEHQRAMGWTYEEHHNRATFKGENCPICGYSIGSSWLYEPLPEDVVDFLASLPETDITPAWA